MPNAVDTVTLAPDEGGRYHPQYVERFTGINKLYIDVPCWTIIGIYFTMHGPSNVKLASITSLYYILIKKLSVSYLLYYAIVTKHIKQLHY